MLGFAADSAASPHDNMGAAWETHRRIWIPYRPGGESL